MCIVLDLLLVLGIHINHAGVICSETLGESSVLISDTFLKGWPDKASKKPSRKKSKLKEHARVKVPFIFLLEPQKRGPEKLRSPRTTEK